MHLRPLSLCIHIPLLNRPWTFNGCIGRPDGRWIFITWSAGGALNVVCVCRDDARAINLPTHKCQSSRGDQTGGRAAGRSQPTDRPSAANPPRVIRSWLGSRFRFVSLSPGANDAARRPPDAIQIDAALRRRDISARSCRRPPVNNM